LSAHQEYPDRALLAGMTDLKTCEGISAHFGRLAFRNSIEKDDLIVIEHG
jgi:hypothetical protein